MPFVLLTLQDLNYGERKEVDSFGLYSFLATIYRPVTFHLKNRTSPPLSLLFFNLRALHFHFHLDFLFILFLFLTMTSIYKLGAMQQLMKGGNHMPGNVISDDSILVKKIVSDHDPERLDYDVKPLLEIVEDILRRSTLSSDSGHVSMV